MLSLWFENFVKRLVNFADFAENLNLFWRYYPSSCQGWPKFVLQGRTVKMSVGRK